MEERGGRTEIEEERREGEKVGRVVGGRRRIKRKGRES